MQRRVRTINDFCAESPFMKRQLCANFIMLQVSEAFIFIRRYNTRWGERESEPVNRTALKCAVWWTGPWWNTSDCYCTLHGCTRGTFNVSQELCCLPSGRQRETNCLPAVAGRSWAPDAWDRRRCSSTHGHRNAELWENPSFRKQARKEKGIGGNWGNRGNGDQGDLLTTRLARLSLGPFWKKVLPDQDWKAKTLQ